MYPAGSTLICSFFSLVYNGFKSNFNWSNLYWELKLRQKGDVIVVLGADRPVSGQAGSSLVEDVGHVCTGQTLFYKIFMRYRKYIWYRKLMYHTCTTLVRMAHLGCNFTALKSKETQRLHRACTTLYQCTHLFLCTFMCLCSVYLLDYLPKNKHPDPLISPEWF